MQLTLYIKTTLLTKDHDINGIKCKGFYKSVLCRW